MATVVKGFVGNFWVSTGSQKSWTWKITEGDVWLFWAEPQYYYEYALPGAFEIVETRSLVDGDGIRRALFTVKNLSSLSTMCSVYVARIA